MKQLIGICDKETEYAKRLMDRINGLKTIPFEMKAFSTPELLKEYLQEEVPEVLLICPTYYCDCLSEIREAMIPHVFLLNDGVRAPSEWSLPQIYKYQRTDHILQMIAEKLDAVREIGRVEGPRIIGVYSPLHRVGKTSFSLALCRELNRSGKALYINLEDISGFEEVLAQEYESDLTDLLYYARQNKEKFAMHLAVLVREYQGIHFIPPAKVPMELKAIRLDEWLEFLQLLREAGIYDVIVLDLGDGLQGLPELMTRLDRIYMPVEEDRLSAGKIRQYEAMLELMDYGEILENTRKLTLPRPAVVRDGDAYGGALLWGPLSGYARELVEEENQDA